MRSNDEERADQDQMDEVEREGLLSASALSPTIVGSRAEADFQAASNDAKDTQKQEKSVERKVKHPTSYTETMTHFLKANIGSGMLAVGDAFKNGGLALSPLLILFIGTLGVFCQHQLMNASKSAARRLGLQSHPDYYDTVWLSFSNGPPLFKRAARMCSRAINVLLVVIQLEFCCIYFVFVSTNIKQVLDQYIVSINVHIYMAIILFPMLLLSWVRNLKFLAPVSLISNAIMCSGIVLIMYTCLMDGLPPVSERNLVGGWSGLPLFFGTVVYCFESISITMPLKNEMKKPHQFSMPLGVLNVGSTLIALLLIGLGSVSYMKFGDAITGAITLNLDQTSILCQVIKLAMSIGIMLTYPIQLYVPVDIMWPSLAPRVRSLPLLRLTKSPVVHELAFRSALVLVTFIVAECVPRLSLFISLVGSMSGAVLAFVIPPLLDWSWRLQAGMSLPRHLLNSGVLLFGVVMSIWGTYTAVEDIVEAFLSGDLNVT